MSFFPDTIGVFRANATLRRVCSRLAKEAADPSRLHALAPADLALVEQCLAQHASVYRETGFIDRLTRHPQLACMLLDRGAKPTSGFLDALEDWITADDRFFVFVDGIAPTPTTPEQWQQHAIIKAMRAAPGLDWLRPLPHKGSDHFGPPTVLAQRLDAERAGVMPVLLEARLQQGIPLVPFNMPGRELTPYLVQAALVDPAYAPYWKPMNSEQVRHRIFVDLLQHGASPDATWADFGKKERSLLVHVLTRQRNWFDELWAKHPTLSEPVLVEMGYMLLDGANAQRPPDMRAAVGQVLQRAAEDFDLEHVMVSVTSYQTMSVAEIMEEVFPGLLNEVRAEQEATTLHAHAREEELALPVRKGPRL